MASHEHVKKLSSSKQKLSLGEVKKAERENKKGNGRKIIRSTVVNSNDYEWPPLSSDNEQRIIDCLKTDLIGLNLPKHKVPLNEIRKVKKEERNLFRHKWLTQKYLEIGFNFSAYHKLRADTLQGVNSISAGLEQNTVESIVIEKDVDPPMLTKLLVPMANSKNVPIVSICGLKQICKDVFNTKCIALGFKMACGDPSHPFHRLSKIIKDVSVSEKDLTNIDTRTEKDSLSSHDSKTNGNVRCDKDKNVTYLKPPKIRKVS